MKTETTPPSPPMTIDQFHMELNAAVDKVIAALAATRKDFETESVRLVELAVKSKLDGMLIQTIVNHAVRRIENSMGESS